MDAENIKDINNEEFNLNEDQKKEYESFENDKEKKSFYDKIKLDWEKDRADLDAKDKPEEQTDQDENEDAKKPYKEFATKEEHSNYMNSKTKSLKKTISDQKNMIKNLRDQVAEKKFKTKIIFMNKEKNKNQNKKAYKAEGIS